MSQLSLAPDRLAGAVVLVVEDHDVVGGSLAAVLNAAGAHAETVVQLTLAGCLEHVDRLRQVRSRLIVLLDLDLGRDLTGEDLLPDLRRKGVKVLVLTGCEEPVRLSRLIRSGVAAVLSKTEPLDHVVAAVEAVLTGSPAMSWQAANVFHLAASISEVERVRREQPFRALTQREGEVLLGLMRGRTVTELAQESVLSVETIRSQVRAILAKLGVRTQLAAVARARSDGWSG